MQAFRRHDFGDILCQKFSVASNSMEKTNGHLFRHMMVLLVVLLVVVLVVLGVVICIVRNGKQNVAVSLWECLDSK